MEVIGWKPLDLIVGGMLTAGVAFGVYKFSITINKKGMAVAEMDASSLQECIALAGRPSELEVAVLRQVGPTLFFFFFFFFIFYIRAGVGV